MEPLHKDISEMKTYPLIRTQRLKSALIKTLQAVPRSGVPLHLIVCWQVRDSRGTAADFLPKNQQLLISVANQGQRSYPTPNQRSVCKIQSP